MARRLLAGAVTIIALGLVAGITFGVPASPHPSSIEATR
jgi:hypothetical protein